MEKTIKEEKAIETKNIKESTKTPMRQIIIETDGNNLNIVKAEVAGNIELVGILEKLVKFINTPNNGK